MNSASSYEYQTREGRITMEREQCERYQELWDIVQEVFRKVDIEAMDQALRIAGRSDLAQQLEPLWDALLHEGSGRPARQR